MICFQYLTDKSSEIECLFIERTKQLMKDNAVCGIVLPISILTNGGIYEKTREMILQNFNIKAIVSLGSGAFMATGIKTIIAFLEKRKISEFNETKRIVDEFLTHFKDVACGGQEKAFSIYSNNVYELNFEDYISFLQDKPTEKAKLSEIFKEYKTLQNKEIIELEREKLVYFITAFAQKVVIGDSGEKDIEKEFYGYEFSNRRGHEGIHIYKDEAGNLNSKLYNEDFNELYDKNKLNSYILRNFEGKTKYEKEQIQKSLEREIAEVQASEDHALKNHLHFVHLSQLMSFDLKKFDKSINLNKRNNLKIQSKWSLKEFDELFDIKIGGTPSRAIELRDDYYKNGNNLWVSVSELNGQIITDTKEKITNKGIIESNVKLIPKGTILMSFKLSIGKVAISGTDLYTNEAIAGLLPKNNNQIIRDYVFYAIQNNIIPFQIYCKVFGSSLNTESIKKLKIPLPPLEIQEKIVAEISEIEKQEQKAKEIIEKNNQKINDLFSNINNEKEITISEIAKNLTAGGDMPKDNFSPKKTEKYQIPIYSNSSQNKGLYGFTDIIKINEPSVTIAARGTIGYTEARTEPFYPIVRLIVFVPKSEIADIFYLKHLLNHTKFIDSGTTTPQLTVPQISGVKLLLPSIDEQQKIITQIEPLEQEIIIAKEFLANVKNLKADILDKYL